MAESSASYHEPVELLDEATMDYHRAVVSLMEELEAIDWYGQRMKAATDDELREILRHNQDDEREHAAMTLEWLRRRDPALDEELRRYLFTERDVVAIEEADGEPAGGDGSLGLGSLRGTP